MIGLTALLLLAFYVWLARLAIRHMKTRLQKNLVIAFFVLAPTLDVLLGNLYFNYLCKSEAGVQVYKTVNLPANYWNEEGVPKFYSDWDSSLGEKYSLVYGREDYSPFLHIENAGYKIVDRYSKQVLGEEVNFRYWGGWVARNLFPHNSAITCEVSTNLINEIFKPY
jgi:hypothetical protein